MKLLISSHSSSTFHSSSPWTPGFLLKRLPVSLWISSRNVESLFLESVSYFVPWKDFWPVFEFHQILWNLCFLNMFLIEFCCFKRLLFVLELHLKLRNICFINQVLLQFVFWKDYFSVFEFHQIFWKLCFLNCVLMNFILFIEKTFCQSVNFIKYCGIFVF